MANRKLIIATPTIFDFNTCLSYLSRSSNECLHTTTKKALTKVISVGDRHYLSRLTSHTDGDLQLQVLNANIKPGDEIYLRKYLNIFFDLQLDLAPCYDCLDRDAVLRKQISKLWGLRLIGIPDLFEGLAWAIIGQQINLPFAYTVKRNFVESYGDRVSYEGRDHYIFPSPDRVASISDEQFRNMKFSRQKVRYLRAVAERLVDDTWSFDALSRLDDETLNKELIACIGIGEWTAQYIMMRCFHRYNSFPSSDAGLHQAVSYFWELDQKPSLGLLDNLYKSWSPWSAYATFYLWRAYAQQTG